MRPSAWVLVRRAVLVPLIFCLLWFAVCALGMVDPLFVPEPYSVLKAGVRLLGEGTFWVGTLATLWRMLAGLVKMPV